MEKYDSDTRIMQLFWHRRDHRTADNRGLAAAADSGEVVPVFCFDDAILDHEQVHDAVFPDPIVDHAERREEAIAMFERARGDE